MIATTNVSGLRARIHNGSSESNANEFRSLPLSVNRAHGSQFVGTVDDHTGKRECRQSHIFSRAVVIKDKKSILNFLSKDCKDLSELDFQSGSTECVDTEVVFSESGHELEITSDSLDLPDNEDFLSQCTKKTGEDAISENEMSASQKQRPERELTEIDQLDDDGWPYTIPYCTII